MTAHVAPAVLLSVVRRHLVAAVLLSLQSCQFIPWVWSVYGCWLCRCQLCGAEFSREMSLLEIRVGCDVFFLLFFCMCSFGFPLKSKWNDWWLWSPSIGPGFVSQPTAFWVWLTCLRRERTGNGCRRMERHGVWIDRKMNRMCLY